MVVEVFYAYLDIYRPISSFGNQQSWDHETFFPMSLLLGLIQQFRFQKNLLRLWIGEVCNNAWTESKCHIVCHISIFYNCTVASHHDGTWELTYRPGHKIWVKSHISDIYISTGLQHFCYILQLLVSDIFICAVRRCWRFICSRRCK